MLTATNQFHPRLNLATIILGLLSVMCMAMSWFLLTQEIGEVNRKLPEDQQISYWWMYAEKYARIKKEYKRLYPSGRLHRSGVIFQIAGFAFVFLAAVAAAFFRR